MVPYLCRIIDLIVDEVWYEMPGPPRQRAHSVRKEALYRIGFQMRLPVAVFVLRVQSERLTVFARIDGIQIVRNYGA